MSFGTSSGKGISSDFPVALLAIALVIGLVAGYVGAGFMSPGAGQGAGFTKLSDSDKNFMVQIANAQVQLFAQQSAEVDWCTALGGKWLTAQKQAQQPVSKADAEALQKQGAIVTQKEDGSFEATVVLLDRGSCAVLSTKGG